MTAPLDEKAIAQAHEAYAKTTGGLLDGNPMVNAIRAYLSTVPLPDELGVVGFAYRDKWRDDLRWSLSQIKPSAIKNRVIEPLVTLSSAQSSIQRAERERDEALAEIERMTPKFVAYEYLESPAGRETAEAQLAEARKVLEPFVRAASALFTRNYNGKDVVVALPVDVSHPNQLHLTAKDFFAARNFLASLREKQDAE